MFVKSEQFDGLWLTRFKCTDSVIWTIRQFIIIFVNITVIIRQDVTRVTEIFIINKILGSRSHQIVDFEFILSLSKPLKNM